jgi:hypothetical protein
MSAMQGADPPSRALDVGNSIDIGDVSDADMLTATEVHVDRVAPDSQASLPEVTRTPEILNVPQDESRGKAHPARLFRALGD